MYICRSGCWFYCDAGRKTVYEQCDATKKEYVIYTNERYETVQLNETDGGLNFHK